LLVAGKLTIWKTLLLLLQAHVQIHGKSELAEISKKNVGDVRNGSNLGRRKDNVLKQTTL
jgi:hypothetical protein